MPVGEKTRFLPQHPGLGLIAVYLGGQPLATNSARYLRVLASEGAAMRHNQRQIAPIRSDPVL